MQFGFRVRQQAALPGNTELQLGLKAASGEDVGQARFRV